MTQNNNNTVTRSNDSEQIDFLDLLLQLWSGKWVIGTFVAIFIVLAAVYITVVQENGHHLLSLPNLMQHKLQLILMHWTSFIAVLARQ